jgi:hypothetical protein
MSSAAMVSAASGALLSSPTAGIVFNEFHHGLLGDVTAQRSLDSQIVLRVHHKLLDMNATRIYSLRRCARRKKTSSLLVRKCGSDSTAIWGVSSKGDAPQVADARCIRSAGQENATVLDR